MFDADKKNDKKLKEFMLSNPCLYQSVDLMYFVFDWNIIKRWIDILKHSKYLLSNQMFFVTKIVMHKTSHWSIVSKSLEIFVECFV
jgi:hypothetical protein